MALVEKGRFEMPAWCGLKRYEVARIGGFERLELPAIAQKARLLVTEGTCLVSSGATTSVLREPQFVDLEPGANGFSIEGYGFDCAIMVFHGEWGKRVGGCGIFVYSATTPRKYASDPVDYPKSTNFDSHYHDCDEYWMILEGQGEVVVGAGHHEVGPGDCVAIGMGHHHDIPRIDREIRSAYFETTLEGQGRAGHLWNHTHGQARPKAERA